MTKTVHTVRTSGSKSEGTLLDLDAGLVYTGDINTGYVEDELQELSINLSAKQVAIMVPNQHPDKVYHAKCDRIHVDEFVSINTHLPYGATFQDSKPVPIYRSFITLTILNNLQVIDRRDRFQRLVKAGKWAPSPTIGVKDIS